MEEKKTKASPKEKRNIYKYAITAPKIKLAITKI